MRSRTTHSSSSRSPRFVLNYVYAFAYYAFFLVTLYGFSLSKRKFLPGSFPTVGNLAHDLWYWSLAIVQWTFFEVCVMRCWAAGILPYAKDEEIAQSPSLIAWNVLWIFLVPIWRDTHFYFAHRFLHIRAVYKYVHSLHHRDMDPEPFSGMCMHPVEHLYYFSNALLPLVGLWSASAYAGLSPLVFGWLFTHLCIAPGCGHSGWEDHFYANFVPCLHLIPPASQ